MAVSPYHDGHCFVSSIWLTHRVQLNVDDLDKHFSQHQTNMEDLLKLADTLVGQYLTAEAYERALYSNNGHVRNAFVNGSPWDAPVTDGEAGSAQKPATGDQILANGMLRMRDEMLHYEFHHGISDGDIGRALNVMAVGPAQLCLPLVS